MKKRKKLPPPDEIRERLRESMNPATDKAERERIVLEISYRAEPDREGLDRALDQLLRRARSRRGPSLL